MLQDYPFEIVLIPAEEGGYTVLVPLLPGCVSEGDTLQEAQNNAQEALELYLEDLIEDGIPIPQPTEKILRATYISEEELIPLRHRNKQRFNALSRTGGSSLNTDGYIVAM